MHQSPSQTSKSFGPQSMALKARRLLLEGKAEIVRLCDVKRGRSPLISHRYDRAPNFSEKSAQSEAQRRRDA
jgi:hypothetical protein